jgi:hypothetical protein
MRVLVVCEESQIVCKAFRARGHEAYSCDILPCSGGHPEWHIQGDVLPLLNIGWDMIIAFPPCTHLAVSGAAHFAKKRADGRQQEGINFFMKFSELKTPFSIENPVGIMSTIWRKPDQIINPYQFGDPFSKRTCLWLNGLPTLRSTKIVDRGEMHVCPSGKTIPKWYSNCGNRKVNRSKTFHGIAEAMANQWGNIIL